MSPSAAEARPFLYHPVAPSWLRLAEPDAEPLSEAELALIWAGQRFPPQALRTPLGLPVGVRNPGRRNGGPGPDFLDAVLELEGRERRGDVELHLRASSFRAHGHHLDPAYDGLALHVVYRADDGAETRLSNGKSAPVAAFAPWVEQRAADLRRWLEQPPLWREPCRDAEARLGAEGIGRALTEAGRARFAVRASALAEQVRLLGEEEALWQALLHSLGVGGDREGFRRLARAFPAALARTLTASRSPAEAAQVLAAALLATAGLAPAAVALSVPLPAPLRPPIAAGGRPANRPQRRLAALAALWARAGGDLPAYARRSVAEAGNAAELVARWSVADENSAAPLGPQRARELVLNAVLPFCAGSEDSAAAGVERLLAGLPPSPAYGRTRFLEENLRPAGGRRRVTNALQQQGLLALLSNWCSQGGCGRCPLSR